MGDAKHLNSMQSNSISLLSNKHQKHEVEKPLLQAMVAHAFNHSSREVEDGGESSYYIFIEIIVFIVNLNVFIWRLETG